MIIMGSSLSVKPARGRSEAETQSWPWSGRAAEMALCSYSDQFRKACWTWDLLMALLHGTLEIAEIAAGVRRLLLLLP